MAKSTWNGYKVVDKKIMKLIEKQPTKAISIEIARKRKELLETEKLRQQVRNRIGHLLEPDE